MTETDNQRGGVCNQTPARSGVSCIGRIGGGKDDWFAELDFDNNEATVVRRGSRGYNIGPIATVPLGQVWPEDDDYDAELMDDEQNRNLMLIVFAPELVRITQDIRNRCVRMAADICQFLDDQKSDREKVLRTAATFIEMIALDIDDFQETLLPPEPCNPEHLAEIER
jgi:hypothetical protein